MRFTEKRLSDRRQSVTWDELQVSGMRCAVACPPICELDPETLAMDAIYHDPTQAMLGTLGLEAQVEDRCFLGEFDRSCVQEETFLTEVLSPKPP